MTATLSSLETRVKTYLSDATGLIFTTELVDEGLRLALGQLNLTLSGAYTLAGLDGAAATTLPAVQESLLVGGAAGYAAQSRVVKRAESFNLEQTVAQALATWGDDRLQDFSTGLTMLINQAASAAKAAAAAAEAARLTGLRQASIPPYPTASTLTAAGWLTDDEDAGQDPYNP